MKKQDKVDIIIDRVLSIVGIVCLFVVTIWLFVGLIMLIKDVISALFMIFG